MRRDQFGDTVYDDYIYQEYFQAHKAEMIHDRSHYIKRFIVGYFSNVMDNAKTVSELVSKWSSLTESERHRKVKFIRATFNG